MSRPIDVVAFLDGVAGASNEIFRLVGSDMQKEAAEARAAVAELMDKADTMEKTLRNLVTAGQIDARHLPYADDGRAALARCGGAK